MRGELLHAGKDPLTLVDEQWPCEKSGASGIATLYHVQ